MTKHRKGRLPASNLTASFPARWFDFQTTKNLPPSRGIIGQDRAMRAVEQALKIETRGFNIFAVGETGSGKTSTLERLLEQRAQGEARSRDLCYVYNFRRPDRPQPLELPAGQGCLLARDVERVIGELERMVPRVLSDGAFGHIRAGILAKTRKRAEDLTRRAALAADRLDLRIEDDNESLRVVALVDGEPLGQEQFEALPTRTRHKIEEAMFAFQEHLDAFTYSRRQLELDHRERVREAERRAVTPLVRELIAEMSKRYKKLGPAVQDFLEEVRESLVENHRAFMPVDDSSEDEIEPGGATIDPHHIYRVNVVVDRSEQQGAPVVVERVPSAENLSGYFEYRETQGGLVTDHTMIRAGALHMANGGYLLIQASELLAHERSWRRLKGALRHKEVHIEECVGDSDGRPRIAGMMKPGQAPLQLKVILVGSPEIYYFLKLEDEEFGRLFKVKADFESTMPRSRENVQQLARFLGKVCREEGHLPLHRGGVTRLVEHAARLAEHKERLTTRRAALLDLLAEANLLARESGARAIRKVDIAAAIEEGVVREGAMADALDREIREGSILIRSEGDLVGQVNGIALYDVISYSFGVPVRITVRIYAGRRGVVNIDREVQLSGAIHDKGGMILVGYLGGRFAQEQTLGLSASITFEQSYDEIDGDSASSAELFAMLSALSRCPINQGIAVTGSVNQLGEIQPIGGVNEKIEGVFRVCKGQGLTGYQGVIIPASNVKNLVLAEEVVAAVKAGKFSIYAIESVDEGIEILTGVPMGRRLERGGWTKGSISERVHRRLAELQSVMRDEGVRTALDRPTL
jgi:lon-related putative ATP-dependent protease